MVVIDKKLDRNLEQFAVLKIDTVTNNNPLTVMSINIDRTTVLGQGSFGSVHPCSVIATQNSRRSELKMAVKINKDIGCKSDRDELIKESRIHSLIYNSITHMTPVIYPWMCILTHSDDCYNGLMIENIVNGTFNAYRGRLLNPGRNLSPRVVVNDYFKLVSILKDIIEKLYDTYRFKHNDLHRGNVMFNNLDPKIIDYGESVIDHVFADGVRVNINPNDNNLRRFYSMGENDIHINDDISEYRIIHKNFPLSDIHLFMFSMYSLFVNTDNGVLPLLNIIPEYIERMEKIYKLRSLDVNGMGMITYDGVVVPINNNFKGIYRQTVNYIRKLRSVDPSNKNVWKSVFGGWDIVAFRIMAYFYAMYIPYKVDYSHFISLVDAVDNLDPPPQYMSDIDSSDSGRSSAIRAVPHPMSISSARPAAYASARPVAYASRPSSPRRPILDVANRPGGRRALVHRPMAKISPPVMMED